MEQQQLAAAFLSSTERTQLVRFCASISGRADVAEDLAQETLLEAWRHAQALHDPERRSQWLLGIARNVCLRWLRKQGRDDARLYPVASGQQEEAEAGIEHLLVDDYDIELDLERKELLELLDRALALLPPETRAALIQHYIDDSPLAEIAAQLGTTTNALAVRLQRGKLAMRRLLTQEMRPEFAVHRQLSESTTWEETSLWCYRCGQRRLLGQRSAGQGKLVLKCPQCSPASQQVISKSMLPQLEGMKSYKPMLTRLRLWSHGHYRSALAAHFRGETIVCTICQRPLTVLLGPKTDLPTWLQADLADLVWSDEERMITTICSHCRTACHTSLAGLLLSHPDMGAFARKYPRVRIAPAQQLEAAGRAAVLTRFESVTEHAALVVISDAETYQVLHMWQEGR